MILHDESQPRLAEVPEQRASELPTYPALATEMSGDAAVGQ